jgi:hypothetical protein
MAHCSAEAPRRRPGSGGPTGVRWTANEPRVALPHPVYARMTNVPRKTVHAMAGPAVAWPATGVGAPARPRAVPVRGMTRGPT